MASVFSADQLLEKTDWVFLQLVRDGWPIDPEKAAKVVNKNLRRTKLSA